MRRALKWLGRLFRGVALAGVLLVAVCAGLWLAPTTTFAETPPAVTAAAGAPTPEQQARAKERAREGRTLYFVSLLVNVGMVVGFLALGGTRWLAGLVDRFRGRWVLALLAVLGILGVGATVLTLPLDYYTGFVFPHRWGLSNQTTAQWLRDYLVNGAVGIVTGIPLAILGYLLLRRAPRTWWLWTAALSVPVAVAMMLIYPLYIAPLFNTFTPLQDETLRQEILALAHQQGIPAQNVYQMDASRQSNAVNAYVVGIGPTHRIVLYDTLLMHFTPDEIKFIMAHEMGHYKLGHIWQGIVASALGALVGGLALFAVSGLILRRYGDRLGVHTLGNPASYPLLMALAMGLSLIGTPLGNAYSRRLEAQADRFAAETYDHRQAGITAFHKLAVLNLADETPPRWVELLLYTHPSIGNRVKALEEE